MYRSNIDWPICPSNIPFTFPTSQASLLGQFLDATLQTLNQLYAQGWQFAAASKDLLHDSCRPSNIWVTIWYYMSPYLNQIIQYVSQICSRYRVKQSWIGHACPEFHSNFRSDSRIRVTRISAPVPAASQERSASCGRKAATNNVRPGRAAADSSTQVLGTSFFSFATIVVLSG